MKISSISVNTSARRNTFIKYANSFMSITNNSNDAIEKTQGINPTTNNKINKSMGIETLTIFPKKIIDGKTIITA